MPDGSVTELLVAWRKGDEAALGALMDVVYADLKAIARNRLARERRDHTLSPTSLVHEMYLRLMDDAHIDWQDRSHFFAVASTVMRRVLVEHGRARRRKKRNGLMVPLRDVDATTRGIVVDILDLDDALQKLQQAGHARESQVVELRFFGGLTIEETAAHLGLGESTVRQSLTFAKAWLYQTLFASPPR